MRTGMMALALGLLTLRFLPVLPPVWLWLLLPVLGLMCLPFRSYPVAFYLFGLSWAGANAQWALDDRLAPELDGETRWIEGRVTGLPHQGEGVVRFQLSDGQSRRARLPEHMRLAWYNGPPVKSGERWRLAVKLKRPVGLLNPHAFDYQAWLLAQRIGATGTVTAGERLAPARGAWRDAIRQRLQAVDAQSRSGALTALVLGDGSGLSRDDWQVLQNTGTVHLLVISGQHVGLLAGVVYLLIAGLARYGCWPSRLPWLPWACGLAFSAALGYGMLAGFEVPVRRACLMIGLVLLWRLRFRHLGAWWPLLLALNGVLLLDPLASLRPGFWLSFAAVAVLLFTFGARLGAWRWWQTWTRAQWLIAIGLCPILLVLGLPISLSGPLANLLAVPWISLVVLPPALLGTFLLPLPYVGEGLLWLAGGLIDGLFRALAMLAGKVPAWVPAAIPLWLWGIGALGAFVLLLPKGMPIRPLGWPMLLLLAFPPQSKLPEGIAEIWQLDVGQGLAIVVRTRHHTLLYDAGPRLRELDLGERVVVPTLRKLNIDGLDLMLISHAHADHAGGAGAVARAFAVKQVISGHPLEMPPQLDAQACESGRQWTWDGVQFRLWQWSFAGDLNQRSCVLQIEAQGERILLTGDIDAKAERALLDSSLAVPTDWLAAPHHGSRSSSSMALLNGLQPKGVLISRGLGNSFGHPHPTVLARYRKQGMAIYDSAEQGAIRLHLGRFEPPWTMRQERRFWRDPPPPNP
ncbi:DNA internalization-related competence protein ComEC/Rec2 [Pseudomonas vancouverensis]|uniref:DNA internalization-related competence protein ComEC/Rec2 n=1 Tax=Pseudomonas vancouverensis TaxID=95300 RepID=A0A1H2MC39_PSEVA|nr:DNA internalization-related competence protein ComEC/Rec2 [Pseudomonas vancouverensis]KAB0499069.1 DNA internalization-related competence protein ComEC/Rec2 [Pseudomonas vancouverensis]TDB57765.1 DNA internalization-related competence protein ComEC/Rec2 [Pseudomonas vancouverensis]SDU90749.1 competence protein ComEC [Pseudomonas vancouverensis]